MLLNADDCHLVLVDYQTRLMPVIFDSERVIANAVRLARMAQLLQIPVWATLQNPDKLGLHVPPLQSAIDAASGCTLRKMHFSAVADGLSHALRPPAAPQRAPQGGNARSLPKHLQKKPPAQTPAEQGRGTVVIAGCEAHVCLLQTALDLMQEFEVWVVTDACSSRSPHNRDAAFDRLASNGVELVTTEMVAFEGLGSADHPAFRDIQGLIK